MFNFMKLDIFRMFSFLLLAFFFYGMALILVSFNDMVLPQVQTILWKSGHISVGAFLGYYIDRSVFRDRVNDNSGSHIHLRRAIIIVGAMIAIALGM